MTSIKTIIENDLCIGCGACLYACDQGNLEMDFNKKKGMFEPKLRDNTKCKSCNCISVCPSNIMDYEDLSQYKFGGPSNSDIGHVESVYLAQSVDEKANLAASSGGIIKETLKFYLETGNIEAAIALKCIDGINYKPDIISDSKGIDMLPGSIYHNVDFSDAIRLIQETNSKLALVAIPCQLEGIYNYIRMCEPELINKISLTIGLMCGWTYNHHALKAICKYVNIPYEQLTDISYRGGGPVGKLQMHTKSGRVTKISRRTNLRYQAAFDRSYNLSRCHYCVNHGNFLADLVVGDSWLPGTVTTKTGISLLISRTNSVGANLEKMKEDGLK